MKLFRPAPSPHQTALAMIGAKAGNAVIVVGASDPDLAAELALVTGLNGRTLVVVSSPEAQSRVEAAATNAGALIDIETAPSTALPVVDGTFDIAVITEFGDAAWSRDQIVREATRAVRPGGRVIVIEGKKAGGFLKMWTGTPSGTPIAAGEIISLLSAAALRGARSLGSAEGISYFEGTKT